MARVTLENLSKSYPEKTGSEIRAVRDVSLAVEDGEFMVLVGPSGCGKSTTLRMIAGLEEITGGTIAIDGQVINGVAPKDRDIAMVFQNYALYPHMSVYDNLAFGLKMRKFPRKEIDTRVREAAVLLGLETVLERKPKTLSGGQRQRVAVGRAIVRHPKVFLFDEPLSNLDAKMRVAMRRELSKLHARLGATMIYVTHDQVEAMTMGDRICVMKDGRIMQVDTPLELYHRPKNLFVAGFIGSPPMNFLRGVVRDENGAVMFVESAEGGEGKGEVKFALAGELAGRARAGVGRAVVLGIRPEDVGVAGAGGGEGIEAKVELFEPMGAEAFVHAHTGLHAVVARAAGEGKFAAGGRAWLRFDGAKAHLFDAGTEEAL